MLLILHFQAIQLKFSYLPARQAVAGRLGFSGHASTLYERSTKDTVQSVHDVLAHTIHPHHPEEVDVDTGQQRTPTRATPAGPGVGLEDQECGALAETESAAVAGERPDRARVVPRRRLRICFSVARSD